MKKSELTFMEGFISTRSNNDNPQKIFDWDKAAEIIKQQLDKPNLIVEAGLQGDWNCTGDIIFEDGKPTNNGYTYLSSNWAIPTLIINADGIDEIEVACYTEDLNTRFGSGSKWDERSLDILGLKELKESE